MTTWVVAGLLLGGAATGLLLRASESTAAGEPVKTGAVTKTVTRPATASAAKATAATPAKTTAATAGKPVTRAADKAAPSAVVQSSEHLDDQVAYQYNALGRRDPFQPLMGGEYVGADVGGDAPPDVGGLKVVGIVWGDADQFALVEDGRGDSHIMRRGDKVMNGYVESLSREAMIVNLTLDGQSQSVRVPLTRKGDRANANR